MLSVQSNLADEMLSVQSNLPSLHVHLHSPLV